MSKTIVPHRFVLLTGAGFSYPFGGLLAEEFRTNLRRRTQLQSRPGIKRELEIQASFEDVLGKVRTDSTFNADDVGALESSIYEVFEGMDSDIAKNDVWRDGREVNVYGVQHFLQRFQCPAQGRANASFLFTVNQDLAVERKWYNFHHWCRPPHHPGVPGSQTMASKGRSFFSTNVGALDDVIRLSVPMSGNIEFTGHTNYIKLHGSVNWRTEGGRHALVIGTGKTQQVENLPLLSAYANVFSQVLSHPGVRLMVIGYSFRDDDINSAISRACQTSDLTVDIWDPNVFQTLDRIRTREDCKGIGDRVYGTWSRLMSDVFPGNQAETNEWQEIRRKFFNENV